MEKLITITFKDELYTKFQQFFDNNRKGILVDALRKNVDMKIKSERELVQKDIKLLKGIEKNLVEETKPEKLKEPSSTVVCFDEFSKAIALGGGIKETSSSSHTKEQKAQYYVQQQIGLLLESLKKINAGFDENSDYLALRKTSSDPQVHHYHLFHLLVIGQAIQNLIGKEIFLQSATPELLIEFDFLKWVRNGLMHDLSISELGSEFSYFGNDMLDFRIKDHGARAYDSSEYLKHLLPKIEATLDNIKKQVIVSDASKDFYKDLLIKELEIAFSKSQTDAEKLIIVGLGKQIESKEWYAPHNKAAEILKNSQSTSLIGIYNNQEEIVRIAKKYNVTMEGFFGSIVQYGFENKGSSGIFIKYKADKDLALFKKDLSNLLNYRLVIINDEHLKEYLEGIGATNKYGSFLEKVKQNSFDKTMGGVALHLAIKNGATVEEVNEILQSECNMDLIYNGYAPVHKTCHVYTENRELLLLLLEYGANPNAQDKRGDTLAHYAAEEDDIELLKVLQSKKADFNIANNAGVTALDKTAECYRSNQEAYDFLSKFTKTNILEKVVLAIKHQDLKSLEQCLNNLEDKQELLNTETEKHGLIAHIACGIGNLEIIKLLEENGCELGVISEDGSTSLEVVCYGDNADLNPDDRTKLITYLIDKVGIDITSSAMHNSLYCADLAIPKLLLDKGGDPNVLGTCDYTPLLILINQPSVRGQTLEVIKLLLQYKADILIYEEYIGNSLHLAAERGHSQVVDILLTYAKEHNILADLLKASPEECRVCGGQNAYEIAIKYKNNKVADKLVSYFFILPFYKML